LLADQLSNDQAGPRFTRSPYGKRRKHRGSGQQPSSLRRESANIDRANDWLGTEIFAEPNSFLRTPEQTLPDPKFCSSHMGRMATTK
jgi:hypothetical protein